jgi:hypothetical protein
VLVFARHLLLCLAVAASVFYRPVCRSAPCAHPLLSTLSGNGSQLHRSLIRHPLLFLCAAAGKRGPDFSQALTTRDGVVIPNGKLIDYPTPPASAGENCLIRLRCGFGFSLPLVRSFGLPGRGSACWLRAARCCCWNSSPAAVIVCPVLTGTYSRVLPFR